MSRCIAKSVGVPSDRREVTEAEFDAFISGKTISTRPDGSLIISNREPSYRELRIHEYPPLAEQIDALWKGGDALIEMRSKILAVKEKFPKTA